jgi:2-hydroxychromene-2-carboxylate isomerase
VAPDLFAGLDADHFPTSTLEALALVARAYRTDPRLGERMSFAVRDALFEQGADISDHVVLAGIAESLGVPLPGEALANFSAVLAQRVHRQRDDRQRPHAAIGLAAVGLAGFFDLARQLVVALGRARQHRQRLRDMRAASLH